jgi:microcystin-dependent protein
MSGYNVTTPRNFTIQEHFTTPIFLPGMMMPYAGSTSPYGWLLCQGQALSREVYSDLFAIIGTQYGIGDGITTFNVPNLQGKVIVGQANANPNFGTLGQSGGEETHTLITSEIPSHNHGVTDPGHSHTQTTINDDFNNSAPGGSGGYPNFNYPSYPRYDGAGSVTWTSTINSSITGISTQTTGNNGAHNNIQPYQVCNYIIKY